MRRKRVLSAALSLLMLFHASELLPVSVAASAIQSTITDTAQYVVASGLCGKALKWWLESDGTLTVSGNDDMTSAPWKSQYSGYKMPSDKKDSDSEKTEEPEADEEPKANEELKEDEEPKEDEKKVTIKKVIIDKDVKSLCENAFSLCSDLVEADIQSTVITEIPHGTFSGCKSLTNVTLPSQLEQISGSAFYGCTSLKAIKLPTNIKKLLSNAFSGCSALETIQLPERLESISTGCFQSCSALKKISIPESVTVLEPSVFEGAACVTVKNQIQYVDCWAVGLGAIPQKDKDGNTIKPEPVSMTSCTIQAGTRGICQDLFRDHKEMTSLTLPDSLAFINQNAFYGTGLTALTIPAGMRIIGENAFSFCISLRELKIEEGLQEIGSSAFSNCNRLPAIILPKSLNKLGAQAFYDCTALERITAYCLSCEIPAKKPEEILGFSTKTEISRTVSCYAKFSWLARFAQNTEGYTYVALTPSSEGWTINNGKLYITDAELIDLEALHEVADQFSLVVFETELTAIPARMFANCTGLYEIIIPETVTEIGEGAFSGCSNLYQMTILNPACTIYDSADTISQGILVGYGGSDAYQYAEKYGLQFEPKFGFMGSCGENIRFSIHSESKVLTLFGSGEMNLSASEKVWQQAALYASSVIIESGITSIAGHAFENCTELTAVTFPDTLKTIGASAFSGCTALDTVRLPDSTRTIESNAFQNCASLGKDDENRETGVFLNEGLETIGDEAFEHCNALHEMILPNSLKSVGNLVCNDTSDSFTLTVMGEPKFSGAMFGHQSWESDFKRTLVIGGNIDLDTIKSQFSFANYQVLDSSALYSSRDGVLYSKDMKELIECPVDFYEKSDFQIPDGVERIRKNALHANKSLSQYTNTDRLSARILVLPESVSCIEDGAISYYYTETTLDYQDYQSSFDLYLVILNPECEIEGLPDGVHICCCQNSTAEKFAFTGRFKVSYVKGECGEGVSYYLDLLSGTLYLYGSGRVTESPWIHAFISERLLSFKEIIENERNAINTVVVYDRECDVTDMTVRRGTYDHTAISMYGHDDSSAAAYAQNDSHMLLYAIEESPYAQPQTILGDINGDGKLSIADAVLLCRYISEDSTLDISITNTISLPIADMDGDAELSAFDITMLLHYLTLDG